MPEGIVEFNGGVKMKDQTAGCEFAGHEITRYETLDLELKCN